MAIKKFERDMLKGGKLQVVKKTGDLSYPIHWHDYFEIIYYKNSGGKCLLNGEEYNITDNCIFFLTPGDFHKIDTVNNSDAFSVNLSFSEDIIDSRLSEIRPLSAKVLYSPTELCALATDKIISDFSVADEFTKSEIYHLINAMLAEILKNGQTSGRENAYLHPVIGKAMLYILTDLSREVTLSEIAETCNMAPAYFSHIFHSGTGKTFKKWLTDIRLDHACRLLEESDQSVLDICFECGFRTVSHFGKVFKASTGTTPREYRKKHST